MSQRINLAPRDDQPPRWALALFALVLMAGVAALFRWLERTDKEGQVAGVPAQLMRPPEEVAPPREVETPPREEELPLEVDLELILTTPDKERLVGRQVAMEDAPVQDVVGDYTFWVGPSEQKRVPVVLLGELMDRQPERRVEVREGQRVRVFGVVRRMRDVEWIEHDRLLSPQDREALRQSEIFISALRVETPKR
jgi:hypothetical protein